MPEDILHNNGLHLAIYNEDRRFYYNEVNSHIMINEWFQRLIETRWNKDLSFDINVMRLYAQ